jgi:hypothetical protein
MKKIIVISLMLSMFQCLNAQDSLFIHQAPKQWNGDTLYSKLIMIRVASDTLIPVYTDSASRGIQINQDLQEIFDFHCTRAGFSLDSVYFIREFDNDSVASPKLKNVFNVIFPDFIEIQSLLDSLSESTLVLHVQPPFTIMSLGIPFYDAGASGNPQPNWHIFQLQAPDAWVFLQNYTTEEPVGIIDNGRVDPNHPEFIDANNCKIYNYCPFNGYQLCPNASVAKHATAVGSIIASIPKLSGTSSEGTISVGYKNTSVSSHFYASQLYLQTPNNSLCGTFTHAIGEFSSNISTTPKILSMSFLFVNGQGTPNNPAYYTPRSQIEIQMDLLQELMQPISGSSKYSRGTMCFAATANNHGAWSKGPGYPFAEPGVVGIGGTTLDTQIGERALGAGTSAHYNYNVNDGYQPIEAYMEFTAPAYNIDVASFDHVPTYSPIITYTEGTSLASPMAATVVATMFVVNSEFANDFYTDPILVKGKIYNILKETADKVRYHPQGLERWQIENLGMVIGNGYRYENTHSITTTGYEFTDPIIDRQMGYGRVNMLSAIMNAAALQTGGFTINGSWTHNEVVVNNVNDHSYLYSLSPGSYNEKYDYDAILNQDGANLIFEGNGATLTINDDATFRVDAGATLTMKSGSLIKVKNNSRIIIDTGGKLVFEDGASIYLEGDNSILEIRGNLQIGANAVFTFTGNGFIRFNLPQPSTYTNVTATSTSSILLEGNSKSDKIAEIMNGSWISTPDAMASFKIKKGTIKMGYDSYINIGGQEVALDNIFVTRLNSTPYHVHGGIFVNGQLNHYINGIEVEHGKVGLTARNFYNQGADVFIRNSKFRHNEVGIRTWGKGARLDNVQLEENYLGWQSTGMDRPSLKKYGTAIENEDGIEYKGSGSGSLYLDNCAIRGNYGFGISFTGKALLTARCGKVTENIGAGFLMGIGSTLNLSSTGSSNTKAGSVNASNNQYNMMFSPYAYAPFLEAGNNNFSIDQSQGPPYPLIAKGSLLWDCYGSGNIIYASHNQWEHNSPTSPPDPSEYDLKTFGCIPNKSLHFDDFAPQQQVICPLVAVEPDPYHDPKRSPLIYCEDCPVIASEYFEEYELDIREGVIRALNKTTYADSLNGDDVLAIAMFYDIIHASVEYYDHEQVQWLADFCYYYMKQSLGSGVSRGVIQEEMGDPSFEKINAVQNQLIEISINYDNQLDQFMYRMDNALLYNLANDRQTALAILAESEACIEMDEYLQEWINQWRAYINAVDLVLTAQNHVMEFEGLYDEGYNGGFRLNAGLGMAIKDTVIQSSSLFSITGSQSTNDNSGNQYFISSVVKDSLTDFLIVKYDASANILWSDTIGGWSKGADTARIVFVDDWDNVYMSGQAWNGSNYDVMTVKYDSTGAKQWIAMHNSSEKWHDVPYGITVDTSGFVYVALKSKSDSGSYHSMITYSQCNCPTGARLANPTLPESYTPTNYLESNLEVYPNPANKQLTITFTDRENEISVKMINALGQEIYKNNFNGVLEIEVSAFPKGVYLIHLEEKSGGTKTVKKVLLQ